MNTSDLETYIRQRYNAVGDTFYPTAQILNDIYAAQMELALHTFCIRNTYTTTSVASQRAYDFPSTTISIRRVEYNGKHIFPNDFLQDDSATGNNPSTTTTGTPVNYQVWGNSLYLRPTPVNSSETIKLYTYDIPDAVTISSTLSVPARYHLALVDYVLYCMFGKDKNYQMASFHKTLWDDAKKKALEVERLRMTGDQFRTVEAPEDLYLDSSRYF